MNLRRLASVLGLGLTSSLILTSCWNTSPRRNFENTLNARVFVTTSTQEQLAITYNTTYEAEFTNATDAYDWTVTRHTGQDQRNGTITNGQGFAPFTRIVHNRLKNLPQYTLANGDVNPEFTAAMQNAFDQGAQQFNDQTKWVDIIEGEGNDDGGIEIVAIISMKDTAVSNAKNYWTDLYGADSVPNFSSKGEDTDGDGFITVTYVEQPLPNKWGREIFGFLNCSGFQEGGSCEPHAAKMANRFTPEELANSQLQLGGDTETELKINK